MPLSTLVHETYCAATRHDVGRMWQLGCCLASYRRDQPDGGANSSLKRHGLSCRDKENADVHLDSENVSRLHAAVVHHSNGKVYLIDLQSVRRVLRSLTMIAESPAAS